MEKVIIKFHFRYIDQTIKLNHQKEKFIRILPYSSDLKNELLRVYTKDIYGITSHIDYKTLNLINQKKFELEEDFYNADKKLSEQQLVLVENVFQNLQKLEIMQRQLDSEHEQFVDGFLSNSMRKKNKDIIKGLLHSINELEQQNHINTGLYNYFKRKFDLIKTSNAGRREKNPNEVKSEFDKLWISEKVKNDVITVLTTYMPRNRDACPIIDGVFLGWKKVRGKPTKNELAALVHVLDELGCLIKKTEMTYKVKVFYSYFGRAKDTPSKNEIGKNKLKRPLTEYRQFLRRHLDPKI